MLNVYAAIMTLLLRREEALEESRNIDGSQSKMNRHVEDQNEPWLLHLIKPVLLVSTSQDVRTKEDNHDHGHKGCH